MHFIETKPQDSPEAMELLEDNYGKYDGNKEAVCFEKYLYE